MTSFELFRYRIYKSIITKIYTCIFFFILFLLKYIMSDKLNHFMKKKIKYFAPNYGTITGIKIELPGMQEKL